MSMNDTLYPVSVSPSYGAIPCSPTAKDHILHSSNISAMSPSEVEATAKEAGINNNIGNGSNSSSGNTTGSLTNRYQQQQQQPSRIFNAIPSLSRSTPTVINGCSTTVVHIVGTSSVSRNSSFRRNNSSNIRSVSSMSIDKLDINATTNVGGRTTSNSVSLFDISGGLTSSDDLQQLLQLGSGSNDSYHATGGSSSSGGGNNSAATTIGGSQQQQQHKERSLELPPSSPTNGGGSTSPVRSVGVLSPGSGSHNRPRNFSSSYSDNGGDDPNSSSSSAMLDDHLLLQSLRGHTSSMEDEEMIMLSRSNSSVLFNSNSSRGDSSHLFQQDFGLTTSSYLTRPDLMLPPLFLNTCSRAKLYLISPYHSASIVGCTDCDIVIGTVFGAVMVSNCERVRITCACRKLIIVNCLDCAFHIATLTTTILSGDCRGIVIGKKQKQ